MNYNYYYSLLIYLFFVCSDPAQAMEKQKLVGMKKIIQKFNTEKFPLVRFMDIERLILPGS